MKYFTELSESDQERALRKLLLDKRLKFNCLTRANVGWAGIIQPCSVVKYYFGNNIMRCDIILDTALDTVEKNIRVDMLTPCDTEIDDSARSTEDLDKSRKALRYLLTTGKLYIFDNKCNAYPV